MSATTTWLKSVSLTLSGRWTNFPRFTLQGQLTRFSFISESQDQWEVFISKWVFLPLLNLNLFSLALAADQYQCNQNSCTPKFLIVIETELAHTQKKWVYWGQRTEVVPCLIFLFVLFLFLFLAIAPWVWEDWTFIHVICPICMPCLTIKFSWVELSWVEECPTFLSKLHTFNTWCPFSFSQ